MAEIESELSDLATKFNVATEIEAQLLEQLIVYCGVDEAGAGPLCGDVVAAAVVLDPNNPIDQLNDSKKLSEKKREILFPIIKERALAYCIARCSAQEIDDINILHASLLAMKRAVEGLVTQPEHVLVDGNRVPRWTYPSEAVVKGDSRVQAIAAASILAKVVRDREMVAFDQQYPGYGFAGHKSAQETMEDDTIDLLIAVGTPISEIGTSGWDSNLLSDKLVHIDATIEHFSRTPMAQHHVCGDLKIIFQQLNKNIRQGLKWGRSWGAVDPIQLKFLEEKSLTKEHGYQITLDDPDACYSDSIPLKPQRVTTELTRNIPLNFRLHLDAGNTWAWFTHYCHRKGSQGYYHIAMGFGSMGWAIGESIGTCFGSKEPSVCITGDGSYLMSGQEITVALQHHIPVIFVIFNDSELGMVKHGQKLGGAEEVGFELPDIDYAMLAQSMGIEGITVRTPKELIDINWQRLGEKLGPTLINIIIDPNEVPPMGQRVKGLADANQSATLGG